jgi:hypothetical protein
MRQRERARSAQFNAQFVRCCTCGLTFRKTITHFIDKDGKVYDEDCIEDLVEKGKLSLKEFLEMTHIREKAS